jgi:hypothetical protein
VPEARADISLGAVVHGAVTSEVRARLRINRALVRHQVRGLGGTGSLFPLLPIVRVCQSDDCPNFKLDEAGGVTSVALPFLSFTLMFPLAMFAARAAMA